MLNHRPSSFLSECPVDGKHCEGQGTDVECQKCQSNLDTLGVPQDFVDKGKAYRPIAEALATLKNLTPPQHFIVDHRCANSQVRYRLLLHIVTGVTTLEVAARKSGLSARHLASVCLGKSGFTYADIAKLTKALFGEQTELLVTLPWVDCGFSISEENPCHEDDACIKLLERGQQEGTVPTKVW